MFSVGAKPFNSQARQLYGGWTAAQARDNLWARKTWHEMSAKYNPNVLERERSRDWMKAYRALPPAYRKTISQQGRPYWNKAVKPRLTDEAKASIFQAFEAVPLSDTNGLAQYRANLFRRAPYPPIAVLNTYPYATAPMSAKVEGMADLTDDDYNGMYTTMRDMLAASRAARRVYRQDALAARAQRIAREFAPAPPAVQPPALPSQAELQAMLAAAPPYAGPD